MKLNLTTDTLNITYECADSRHDDFQVLDMLRDLIDILNNHDNVNLIIQSTNMHDMLESEEHPIQD